MNSEEETLGYHSSHLPRECAIRGCCNDREQGEWYCSPEHEAIGAEEMLLERTRHLPSKVGALMHARDVELTRRLDGEEAQVPAFNPASHPYEVYFFGVWSEREKGHYLRNKWGQSVRAPTVPEELDGTLDCAPQFMPTLFDPGRPYQSLPQPLGVVRTQQVIPAVGGPTWTVMSMWDRSADSRGNCNASFLTVGVWSTEEMWALAARDFPEQVKRIREFKEK